MKDPLIPLHPGEVLAELYLEPLSMSAGNLAGKLKVPRTRIERLLKQTTGMTPDTALRLAQFFETSPQYWMNLQTNYDLHQQSQMLKSEIERIDTLSAA